MNSALLRQVKTISMIDRLSDQTGVNAVFSKTSVCAVRVECKNTVGSSGFYFTAVCATVLCTLFPFVVKLFGSVVCTGILV